MALKESLKIFVRRLMNSAKWAGDFAGWEQAQARSTGYDAEVIFKKVEAAALKVKNGEAPYERDSVVFDEIEYSWPVLSALLYVATLNNNQLKVLDFGGALGTSYYQNRKFISHLQVEWNIVEQEKFVQVGKEKMADDQVGFYYSIDEYIEKNGMPHVLLLSGTLPYIEKPYELLEKITSYNIPYLLIDNTYFNFEDRDRITVQTVPPEIYEASYPCWFLSYSKVKQQLAGKYDIFSEHVNTHSLVLDGRRIYYQGFLASKAPFSRAIA